MENIQELDFCINGYHIDSYYKCNNCKNFTSLYTIYYNNENVNGKYLHKYDKNLLKTYCMYCTPEKDLMLLEPIFCDWYQINKCCRCENKFDITQVHGQIYITYDSNESNFNDVRYKITSYNCFICGRYNKDYILLNELNKLVTFDEKLNLSKTILICGNCNCSPLEWNYATINEETYGHCESINSTDKIESNPKINRIRKILSLKKLKQ